MARYSNTGHFGEIDVPSEIVAYATVKFRHRRREGNFLLIKKSNLYDAYRNLNATALCLYLYLAGNMNGYNLEFSPKAIHRYFATKPQQRRSCKSSECDKIPKGE